MGLGSGGSTPFSVGMRLHAVLAVKRISPLWNSLSVARMGLPAFTKPNSAGAFTARRPWLFCMLVLPVFLRALLMVVHASREGWANLA